MKASIPTEIRIKEIKITNLDTRETGGSWVPMIVTCDIMPLGIANPQRNVSVTMSSQLSPHLIDELIKILEQDMGLMVEELQKEDG